MEAATNPMIEDRALYPYEAKNATTLPCEEEFLDALRNVVHEWTWSIDNRNRIRGSKLIESDLWSFPNEMKILSPLSVAYYALTSKIISSHGIIFSYPRRYETTLQAISMAEDNFGRAPEFYLSEHVKRLRKLLLEITGLNE